MSSQHKHLQWNLLFVSIISKYIIASLKYILIPIFKKTGAKNKYEEFILLI